MAVPLLFEPFVEVDAFGIFPGGAGEKMEMTNEDFGINVEQPFGFARRRLRSVGGTFSCGGGRGFPGLFSPARFQALLQNYMKINKSEAADRSGKLQKIDRKALKPRWIEQARK